MYTQRLGNLCMIFGDGEKFSISCISWPNLVHTFWTKLGTITLNVTIWDCSVRIACSKFIVLFIDMIIVTVVVVLFVCLFCVYFLIRVDRGWFLEPWKARCHISKVICFSSSQCITSKLPESSKSVSFALVHGKMTVVHKTRTHHPHSQKCQV